MLYFWAFRYVDVVFSVFGRASPVVSPEPQSADLPGTISPPPIVPLSLPTAAKHCNLGDLVCSSYSITVFLASNLYT